MAGELERRLSLADSVFFEIGGIIGAGVFVLLGMAAGLSGPAIVLAVILAGFVSFVTALSYAEMSSAIPVEGGEYEYARKLISPRIGTFVGLGWLVADITASALVSMGFASYFITIFPSIPLKAAALGAVALVTAVNVFGVKFGARANNVVSALKVGVLALFIILAFTHFNAANFSLLAPNGAGGVIAGSALFFFAFSGFGKITRLGEEVINAEENLPRSIMLALALCTVLYVLAAVALVGAVGWVAASSSDAPLANAIASLGYNQWAFVIVLGALAATLSVLLTNNAGISRIMLVFGRRHASVSNLSEVHSRLKTPWKALLLAGASTAVLVLLLDLRGVASFASFLFLFYYGAVNVTALLARSRKDWNPRFRTPFFPLFPIVGVLSCALLLAGMLLGIH